MSIIPEKNASIIWQGLLRTKYSQFFLHWFQVNQYLLNKTNVHSINVYIFSCPLLVLMCVWITDTSNV